MRQSAAARATHLAALRQGRFTARAFANPARWRWRIANRPWRWAWRNGWWAGFVGWYGPLFWPYAYADIFGWAFWPWGYDPYYWDYAYDNFFDGVFYGEAAPSYYSGGPRAVASASYASVAQLCKQPGEGITAFPFAEIERTVQLTDEQKPLFSDFQNAAKQAADQFAAACPADNTFPATVPGRLQLITARLQATDDAIQTVKPALDKFYASLSDEQKERFNKLGPRQTRTARAARASAGTTGAAAADQKQACGEPKTSLTNLPMERIRQTVKPTEAQEDALKQLQDATGKAVETLQAACPGEPPITPPARLDAMSQHLRAMIEAANTVKPPLERFYASLSDEQKARFDRMGREMASE